MNERTEVLIGTAAAFLVLISAMVNPRISAAVAAVCLVALAVYHWYVSRRAGSPR